MFNWGIRYHSHSVCSATPTRLGKGAVFYRGYHTIYWSVEDEMRKLVICPHCKHYQPETREVEGECLEDEDINSEEFCTSYEKKNN